MCVWEGGGGGKKKAKKAIPVLKDMSGRWRRQLVVWQEGQQQHNVKDLLQQVPPPPFQ